MDANGAFYAEKSVVTQKLGLTSVFDMTYKLRLNSAQSSSSQIEQFYAQEILTGRLAPGSRLPSNGELAAKWKTSARAVHAALGGLVAQGLLDRKQRRGTFVRDLFQNAIVGLLVGGHLVREDVAYFRMLCAELQEALEESRFSCRIYDDLWRESQVEDASTPSLKHFLLDRKVYDFRGFIYIGTATIGDLPALRDLRPRVVHMDSTRGLDLVIDMPDFIRTTMREMAARGFKNLAYIRPLWKNKGGGKFTDIKKELAEVARECQIPAPQSWDLILEEGGHGENDAYKLLIKGLKERRLGRGSQFPDAIIIPDDVIARPLIFALREMEIRVPKDLSICIMANSGIEHFYGAPVYRYEISIRNMAQRMVELLKSRIMRVEDPALPMYVKGQFLEMA